MVDDVAQSIEVVPDRETPGYWPAMLPETPPNRALLLGHAGGTIARLLLDASPSVEIVAVDDDPRVLALAAGHPYFRIDDPRLRVDLLDAFDAARALAAAGERFDYVAVDLYRGAELVREALSRPFLRRVADLLADDGVAAFNLPRDRRTARRIRRLGQHLRLQRTALIGLNCVVHCGRQP